MGTYIPFTEQQREQARRTDLAASLRQCGEKVKRSGSENMWLDHGQIKMLGETKEVCDAYQI